MDNPRPWDSERTWVKLTPRQKVVRSLLDYVDAVGARGFYSVVTDEREPIEFEVGFRAFHD